MRSGEGVRDRHIPGKRSATCPRHKGCSIRSLPVVSEKADWFFASGYLGFLYRSSDDVIELRVANVARCTFSACKTMKSSCVDRCLAYACMGLA